MNTIRSQHKRASQLHLALVVSVLVGLWTVSSDAGYRPVNRDRERQKPPTVRAAREFRQTSKVVKPSGGWSTVEILRNDETLVPSMHRGTSNQITLEPSEEVQVVLHKARLPAGIPIFLYTLHGGRINAKRTETVRTQEGGRIEFTFTIGPWRGNYPVVVRHAGREEEISFWVEKGAER